MFCKTEGMVLYVSGREIMFISRLQRNEVNKKSRRIEEVGERGLVGKKNCLSYQKELQKNIAERHTLG
jgi:hypothetical protein